MLAGEDYAWREARATEYRLAICRRCEKLSFWHQGNLVFPAGGSAPPANPDLPEDVTRDYEEARAIASVSPRGAAALLRLAIQKLCIHLGEKGKKLDDDIASLVKKGLPEKVQKALDTVRVVGNNAVHPGELDIRDDPGIAESLFDLVNMIGDAMITQPQKVDALYGKLPVQAKEQIERRDGKVRP